MQDKVTGAIEVLLVEIEEKTKELNEIKKMVNFLAKKTGQTAIFNEAELNPDGSRGLAGIRADQYYGKSPTVAAREYLEAVGRAVNPDEILQALGKGGFDFESQGWKKPESRSRNLAISMSKNSQIFHRLPNGTYGLVKFYPEVEAEKRQKRHGAAKQDDEPAEESNGTVEENQE